MNLANKFTLGRLFFIPLFVLAALYYRADSPVLAHLPLAVFLAAISTDAMDGFIARRFGQATRFGRIADPLADKCLLAAAFITLAVSPMIPAHLRIPWWVLVIVLARDAFIIAGSAAIYLKIGYLKFKPSALGKATTFLQMITILSVLLRYELSPAIWTVAAVFTVLSGAQYLLKAKKIVGERAGNGA